MILSIGMMVKDESKYLDRCLTALKPLVEAIEAELIIVDTGSTDNTIEIAKKYTDKLYFHKWNNNFSEMRNIVISHAKGEWFFTIDGDEILENPESIIDFFTTTKYKKYNSATMSVKNITNDKDDTSYSLISMLRLFKRDKDFKYQGSVHNQPISKGPTYNLDSCLVHYGYLATDKKLMEKKFKRTSEILKRELEKEPDRFYYWYQLSASYLMHRDLKEALPPIEKAYKICKDKNIDLSKCMYIYVHYAMTSFMNSQYYETIEVCKEGINTKRGYIDLYYYMANSYIYIYKYEEAIKAFEDYINACDKFKYSDASKDISVTHLTYGKYDEILLSLTVIYDKLNNSKKSIEYLNRIDSLDILEKSIGHAIDLYLKNGYINELFDFYSRKIKGSSDKIENMFFTLLNSVIDNRYCDIQEDIYNLFSKECTIYNTLFKVKTLIKNDIQGIDYSLRKQIEDLDFNNLNNVFGDIIYYYLKKQYNLNLLLENCKENNINMYFEYILNRYEDATELIYDYLNRYASEDMKDIRINKLLERYALVIGIEDECKYKEIFYRFVSDGTAYIQKIYNNSIVEHEEVIFAQNEEDCFLIYMYKANKCKNIDKAAYISYLNKALKIYETMKKGIEILLRDFEEYENANIQEFERYKSQVKNIIKNLLSSGDLETAKSIISEYESIVKDDVEIILFKSQIAIKDLKEKSTN